MVSLLRAGLQTDNYFNQNVPIVCQSYSDGPDNAIRLLKTELNSLICRLLEIDLVTFF